MHPKQILDLLKNWRWSFESTAKITMVPKGINAVLLDYKHRARLKWGIIKACFGVLFFASSLLKLGFSGKDAPHLFVFTCWSLIQTGQNLDPDVFSTYLLPYGYWLKSFHFTITGFWFKFVVDVLKWRWVYWLIDFQENVADRSDVKHSESFKW